MKVVTADLERISDILESLCEGQISADLALILAYNRGTYDGRKIYEQDITDEAVNAYLYGEELNYESYEPIEEEENRDA